MTTDEAHLRQEGERIEALLTELSEMAGPQTWPRVEELVQRMLALYGAGLARVLRHAREGEAEGLDERLAADELVSSLLLLHGLHPCSTEERVRRALERVRPYLGSHGGGVKLLAVEGSTAHLSLSGSCDGCPSSRATVETTLRHAIEEEAPEITRLELGPERADALVQLGEKRKVRWLELSGLDRIASGALVDAGGVPVLVVRVTGGLVAYRDRCGCGALLEPAHVTNDVLSCGCGRRYDVARGGRSADGQPPHLVPVPLLPSAAGHRIAIPEESS